VRASLVERIVAQQCERRPYLSSISQHFGCHFGKSTSS
jgi:hypothetical protein